MEGGRIVLRLARPPLRKLLKKLQAEEPEAIRELGRATGHDAAAFFRLLRGREDVL